MDIEVKNNNFKKTIIFFPGYRKTGIDFNEIEPHLSKTHNTVLVTIRNYCCSIHDLVIELYDNVKELANTKLILVSHSYGSFYAIDFVNSYQKLNTVLVMLEPCLKADYFLAYLKSLPTEEVNSYKIANFDSYPDHNMIPKQCIVKVHLNFDGNNLEQIYEINTITKVNMKSRLMIHANVGHMIHYKIPHVIIDTIKSV